MFTGGSLVRKVAESVASNFQYNAIVLHGGLQPGWSGLRIVAGCIVQNSSRLPLHRSFKKAWGVGLDPIKRCGAVCDVPKHSTAGWLYCTGQTYVTLRKRP